MKLIIKQIKQNNILSYQASLYNKLRIQKIHLRMASKRSSATPIRQYQLSPIQEYLFFNTIYNKILQISVVNQTQKTISYECRFINTDQVVSIKLINYVGIRLVDIKEGRDIKEERDRVGVEGCQIGFWDLESIVEQDHGQQAKDQKGDKLCRFLLQMCLLKLQLSQQKINDKSIKAKIKANLLHDADGVLYSNMIVYKKQTEVLTYLCQCGRYSKGLTLFEVIKLKNLLKNLHFRGLSYHNLDANAIVCISFCYEQPDKQVISLKIDEKIHIAQNQLTFQQQLQTLQQIIKQYFSPANQCQSQTQSIPNLHPITPPSSPVSQPQPYLPSQFQACTFLPTFLRQPQISICIEELPNVQILQQYLKNSKLIKNNRKLDEGELSWYKEKYKRANMAKKCLTEGLMIGDWEQQSACRQKNKIQLLMKDYWSLRKGQYKAGMNMNSQLGWGDLDIRSSFQDEPTIFAQNLQKYIKSLTGLLQFKKCRKAYHFYSAKLNQRRRCNFLISLHHLKQLWLLLESEQIRYEDYNAYLNLMTERHVVSHEMARILLQTKKVKECLEWYQRSLNLKQIIYGMYSPNILSSLYNILYVLIQHCPSINFPESQSDNRNHNEGMKYFEVNKKKMITKSRMKDQYKNNNIDIMRQQQLLMKYVQILSKVKNRITNEQVLAGWLNSVEVRKSGQMISIVEQHIWGLYSDPWRQALTQMLANKKNMKILSQQQKQGPNMVNNSNHNQNSNVTETNSNAICQENKNNIQQLVNHCEVGFIWEHTFIQHLGNLVASIQQSPNKIKQKELKILNIVQNLSSKPLEAANICRIACLKNYIELSLGSTNKIDHLHQLKIICTSLSQLISSSAFSMSSQKTRWLGHILMGVKEIVYLWEWRVYEQGLAQGEIHVDGLDQKWIVECYFQYPERAANLPYRNTINLESRKCLNNQFTNIFKQRSLSIDDNNIKLIQYCLLVLRQYKDYAHIIKSLRPHQNRPITAKTSPHKYSSYLMEYLLGISYTVVQEYSKGIVHIQNLLQLQDISPQALVDRTSTNHIPALIRIDDNLNQVDMRVKRLYCLLEGGGIDVRGCVACILFCCFKTHDYSLFSCWFQVWEALARHLYIGGVLEMAIQVYYSLSTTNSQHLLKSISLIERLNTEITNIEHIQILAKMPERLLQYLGKKLQYKQQADTNQTNSNNHEKFSIQQNLKGNIHNRERDRNDDGQLKVVVQLIQRQVGFAQVDAERYWHHVFKTLTHLLAPIVDYQLCYSNYVRQNTNQIIQIIDRVMSMLFYKSAANCQYISVEQKSAQQISLQTYRNVLEHVEWQLQHSTQLQSSDRNTRLQKMGSYIVLISRNLKRMPKSMQNRVNGINIKYQALDNKDKDKKNRFGNSLNESKFCIPSYRLLAGLQCRNHILMLLQVLAILLEKYHSIVEEVFIIQLFIWLAEGKLVQTTTQNLKQKQSFLLQLFSISKFLYTNNNEKQELQNEATYMRSGKNKPINRQQLQNNCLNDAQSKLGSCSKNSQVFEQYEVNDHISELWPIIQNIKFFTQEFIRQYFDFINGSQSMQVDELACQVEDLVCRLDVLQQKYQTILPLFHRQFVDQVFIKIAKDTLLSI